MEKDLFSKITKSFTFNRNKDKKSELHALNNTDEYETANLSNPSSKEEIKEEVEKSKKTEIQEEIEVQEKGDEETKNDEHKSNNKVDEELLQSSKSLNELKEIITSRRSVRQFTNHKISHKIIYDIIKTATHSPKAGNVQTFHTIIINDESKIATLANLSYQQSWIAQAKTILVITSNQNEISNLYPDMSQRFATQTTTCYIHSILLLLHAAGFSTCWVESFQEEVIKSFLGISGDSEIHALLPIGFAKEIPKEPILGDLTMSISYNSYGNKSNY